MNTFLVTYRRGSDEFNVYLRTPYDYPTIENLASYLSRGYTVTNCIKILAKDGSSDVFADEKYIEKFIKMRPPVPAEWQPCKHKHLNGAGPESFWDLPSGNRICYLCGYKYNPKKKLKDKTQIQKKDNQTKTKNLSSIKCNSMGYPV